MNDDFVPWPDSVLKPEAEWSEFDRDYIEFMRLAYSEGFQPRRDSVGSAIAANGAHGRSILLVWRGSRNGWEPFLSDNGESVPLGPIFGPRETSCVCVRPPFRAAGQLALEWLRGQSLDSILRDFRFVGGFPGGIELRSASKSPGEVQYEEPPTTFDPLRNVPKWRDLTLTEREEVRRLLSIGKNVGAITYYRQISDLGLAAAKESIELLLANDSIVPAPRQTKPCPFCGQPLRTALAQQCLNCGEDWHSR